MSGCHSKHSKQMHSLFKTILRKSETSIKLIALCIRHTLWLPHHGGAGCPRNRDIDLQKEDAESTGQENDNESTSGLDATIFLGGPEAEGQHDHIHSNQAKLTALMREINDLCQ